MKRFYFWHCSEKQNDWNNGFVVMYDRLILNNVYLECLRRGYNSQLFISPITKYQRLLHRVMNDKRLWNKFTGL